MRQKMNMCAICHEGSKSSETTDLLSFLMGHSLSSPEGTWTPGPADEPMGLTGPLRQA